jgi:energy-coupling factor transporter ATP-binding protein EcfA2
MHAAHGLTFEAAMLTAITLNDFKSYRAARLPLASLTVLIGANASGKSNAIEAMRLLAWLAQGHKLSSIQYAAASSERIVRGRLEDLAYAGSPTFGLGCETDLPEWNLLTLEITRGNDGLHITAESLSHSHATVPLYMVDERATGQGTDVSVAYNNFAKGRNKPRIRCTDQMAIFSQLVSPAAINVSYERSQAVIPKIANDYVRWLSAMLFLDAVPARMREYSFRSEKRIFGDGSNLSGVLFNLWGPDALASEEPYKTHRAEVLALIQSLPEQDISGLTFLSEPRGGVMVRLTETFGGRERSCDAALLSDGTLRVLAIAAAMLTAEEGSLVVIEEIDNGVHPSRAHHLLTRIQSIAERRKLRVVLSTHNPARLDALPDSAVPDVVFCYRDPIEGASRLVRLEEIPDYPDLIAQGPLGRLVASGLLERFVKSPASDKRKARALEWLRVMGKLPESLTGSEHSDVDLIQPGADDVASVCTPDEGK